MAIDETAWLSGLAQSKLAFQPELHVSPAAVTRKKNQYNFIIVNHKWLRYIVQLSCSAEFPPLV